MPVIKAHSRMGHEKAKGKSTALRCMACGSVKRVLPVGKTDLCAKCRQVEIFGAFDRDADIHR